MAWFIVGSAEDKVHAQDSVEHSREYLVSPAIPPFSLDPGFLVLPERALVHVTNGGTSRASSQRFSIMRIPASLFFQSPKDAR
jgi:hypothetical protein